MSISNATAGVQWEVTIQDVHIPNVLDVGYGLEVETDRRGNPTDAYPRLKTIRIVRRSDAMDDFAKWVFRPWQEYWRSGVIELLDARYQHRVIKRLEWTEGYLKRYQERVPHVDLERGSPQIETLDIAVGSLRLNGVEWSAGGLWVRP
jgi:hypothetical protein